MTLRFSALLVWTFAAAAAVFWALRLLAPSAALPDRTEMASMAPPVSGDLTRLLGAAPAEAQAVTPVAPDAATRFRLTGVVATRTERSQQGPPAAGLALISVDGKPPQAYRVGDSLDNQFSLVSVGLRSARVGTAAGAGSFQLELPPPTPAATGVPNAYSATPGMPTEVLVPPPAPPAAQGQMLPLGMPVPGTPPPGGADPTGRNRALTQ